MYCRSCGSKNSEQAVFCGNCGAKLTIQVPQPITPSSPRSMSTQPTLSRSQENNFLLEFFRNNAYHILGIDTTFSTKDIQKRAREIITRLKIDDIPSYNLDFEPAGNFRTEGRVKIALQNLSSPKQCLKEFFFWFDLEDLIDQDITKFLKEQQIQHTLTLWQKAIDTVDNRNKRFIYQKNLSISYSILMASGRFKPYLLPSLDAWGALINSEAFWIFFFERYQQKTEFELNAETMNEFKTRLPELLSNLYAEIGQITQDPDYFKEFQKKFSVKGEKIEKDVLFPLLNKIFQSIEILNAIEITKGDYQKKSKYDRIIQIINLIQEDTNKLTTLALHMDSQALTARDKAAEMIRSRATLIFNNWEDAEKALVLLQLARPICGTSVTTAQIEEDIVSVNEIVETQKKNGTPIKSAPTLYTLNGCGTTLYGDTQYFALIFIPILPLARFSVENVGNNSYNFFGRLNLHPWQQIWQYLFVTAIGFLLISYWILIILLIWFIYLRIQHKPILYPTQSSISSPVNNSQSEYYYNQGCDFTKTKEYEKALAAYNQAITNNNKDANTWNNKSYVLTKLRRYDEAIEAGRVAVRLAPNDAEIRDTLQTALRLNGG